MLEIKNVDKYFHRGRKNQIHVINHTNLTLPTKGLVTLLGPSGCGKTTLLNTIGGLDKIKSGSIYLDGQKISTNRIHKVDQIRNAKIGYIFQDYKLVDYLSVFDNVALVLKMLGIKDKQEIKTKVEYVLTKVGMLRYQKRPASMLSGGERQRVGIARAIVKNPDLILADEPTGNLDSRNTLEIMNIIKAISQERLVILVTHEQELAHFYATRIIEIEDGTIIKDYENTTNSQLDYRHDNTFYLKDFSNQLHLKPTPVSNNSNYDLKIYSDKPIDLTLSIVIKNNNIYLQAPNQTKIELVENNSSIEFINDHYQKLEKNQFKYHFDFTKLALKHQKRKYTSIFNPWQLLTNGFKQVFNFPLLKKFLLAGFFLAAIFIMYATSSIVASLTINEKNFIQKNKSYLLVKQAQSSIDKYLEYEQLADVDYLLPGNSVITLSISLDDYYQTQNIKGNINGSLATIHQVTTSDVIYGRLPKTVTEIVIDKLVLERALEQTSTFQMAGLTNINSFLNKVIAINNLPDLTIVGITDTSNPSIYVDPSLFINIIANTNRGSTARYYSTYDDETKQLDPNAPIDYHLYQDKITLTQGRFPDNDYEVLVPASNIATMPLNKEIDITIAGKKLTVVGYYDSREGYSYKLVNSNMIKLQTIENNSDLIISTTNKEAILKLLKEKQVNIEDCYVKDKQDYLEQQQETIHLTLIVSGIILLISLIEIFLMIRSSFLSRIKEVGIYRAIGVKTTDIYKMFAGEIIAITTIASLPGLIFMAYILSLLAKIKYLANYLIITPSLIITAILFTYSFNLLIGLIPVYNTIKKRPAEILARHDLD